MLLDTAEGSAILKDNSPMRAVCDSACKLLSTVVSNYSCQDPRARGLDPLKAGEKLETVFLFFSGTSRSIEEKVHGVCTLTKVYQYAKEERFLFLSLAALWSIFAWSFS